MTKRRIDLSNPGGHPKDWLDRVKESGQDDWWHDLKMSSGCLGIVIGGAASICALIYGLLKLTGKL